MRKAIIETATGKVVNVVNLPGDWTGADGEWKAPDGHSVVDASNAAPGDTWDGESFTKPSAPVPTVTDVQAECARRLALGFDYDFADARGVHRIGTTDKDMAGWREVTDFANALINASDTETTITIATDTGPCEVTASEWNAVLIAAAAFRQPIWLASFTIQAQDPIPADYADDEYWVQA